MTWKDLAKAIIRMTDEQQEQDVLVRVSSLDEFFGRGSISLEITGEGEDVADPNSYYLDVDG